MKNKRGMKWMSIITIIFAFSSCSNAQIDENKKMINESKNMDKITLGAGCFWCVEAVFSELKGVESVVAGYAGGTVENPSYKEVCEGNTGHAEVAQISYDPSQISLADILQVFWKTHDPTTLNRQGADVGTQYRSVIFYHTKEQGKLALQYKKELSESGAWKNPLVTEVLPIPKFYRAENYHQDYYSQNGDQQYCKYVIQPKLDKFRKVFASKLK
jgi:peptide-methionine (S)-S-oxide reductase